MPPSPDIPHSSFATRELLNERWVSVDILGSGSFSSVDKVTDAKNNNTVYARKTLTCSNSTTNDACRKELEHIKKMADHHHFITVVETFDAACFYGLILSPVADSGSLQYFLSQISQGLISLNATNRAILYRAFGCLASALDFMDQQRIRHKDIKPANILLHKGMVLYTDFGSALDWTQNGQSTTRGSVESGTKKYSAPEVQELCARRNRKSDVFSLGCVFLEILYLFDRSVIPVDPFHHGFSFSAQLEVILPALQQDNTRARDQGLQGSETTALVLRTVRDVCYLMLQYQLEDRPTAVGVVALLQKDGDKSLLAFFCEKCRSPVPLPTTHLQVSSEEVKEARGYVDSLIGSCVKSMGRQRNKNGTGETYACTSGCWFSTDDPEAWKDHELDNEPQEVWLCGNCKKSENPPFRTHRRAKFLDHIKKDHKDVKDPQHATDLCKVDFVAGFRNFCGFCGQYFSYSEWAKRQEHVMEHFDRNLAPCDMGAWQTEWKGRPLKNDSQKAFSSEVLRMEDSVDELLSRPTICPVQIDTVSGKFQGLWCRASKNYYVLMKARKARTKIVHKTIMVGENHKNVALFRKEDVKSIVIFNYFGSLHEDAWFRSPAITLHRTLQISSSLSRKINSKIGPKEAGTMTSAHKPGLTTDDIRRVIADFWSYEEDTQQDSQPLEDDARDVLVEVQNVFRKVLSSGTGSREKA